MIEACFATARQSAKRDIDRVEITLTYVVPLIYAVAAFAVAAFPLIQAERTGVVTLIAVCSLGLFVSTAVWALEQSNRAYIGSEQRSMKVRRWTARHVAGLERLLDISPAEKPRFSGWWIATSGAYVWSAGWIAFGLVAPLPLSSAFGTLGIVFLGMSALLPIVGTAVIATRRARFPTFLLLVLAPFILPAAYSLLFGFSSWVSGTVGACLAVIAALFLLRGRTLAAGALACIIVPLLYLTFVDSRHQSGIQHEIRTHAPLIRKCTLGEMTSSPCTATIESEIDTWRKQAALAGAEQTNYVVFVSAAGGGLRAAYWTASVLTRLNDCVPNFNGRLFAISGVSGGSLGAAIYAALVRDFNAARLAAPGVPPLRLDCGVHPLTIADVHAGRGWAQSQLTRILQNDFLAPIVANLIFRDLPQALIPIRLLPDRAASLEKAIEQAWTKACESRDYGSRCEYKEQFAQSFFDVRESSVWIPLLLLNGTHQETGKRVLTSSIQINPNIFNDTYGFFHLTHRDIALSTAVLNSARFPFVSPAGAMTEVYSNSSIVDLRGHIIDGGFFENSGTSTLKEAIEAFLNHPESRPGVSWRPLVIEILNDVDMSPEDLSRTRPSLFQTHSDAPLMLREKSLQDTFANQLVSAAEGLYATRSARGILASKELADYVRKQGGEFLQFRLCPYMAPSPPLGWLLTADSRAAMDDLLLGHTRTNFQKKYETAAANRGGTTEYLRCFNEIQMQLSSALRMLANSSSLREANVAAQIERQPK